MAQLKSGARKDQTTGKEGGRAGRILGKFKKNLEKGRPGGQNGLPESYEAAAAWNCCAG